MLPDYSVKHVPGLYHTVVRQHPLHARPPPKKRAVEFKLSDGTEVPDELATTFKFARQKTKLSATVRGSMFVAKGEY